MLSMFRSTVSRRAPQLFVSRFSNNSNMVHALQQTSTLRCLSSGFKGPVFDFNKNIKCLRTEPIIVVLNNKDHKGKHGVLVRITDKMARVLLFEGQGELQPRMFAWKNLSLRLPFSIDVSGTSLRVEIESRLDYSIAVMGKKEVETLARANLFAESSAAPRRVVFEKTARLKAFDGLPIKVHMPLGSLPKLQILGKLVSGVIRVLKSFYKKM